MNCKLEVEIKINVSSERITAMFYKAQTLVGHTLRKKGVLYA